MNTKNGLRRHGNHQAGVDVNRRTLLKLTGVGVAALGMMPVGEAPAFTQGTLAWDKTFPQERSR